jgi:GxxExxY protein
MVRGPPMNADERRYDAITSKIIAAVIAVSNELGVGFLEVVYKNALFVELTRMGLRVEREKRLLVRYHGVVVGEYYADLIVEDSVIVEAKHATGIADGHFAQVLNYLKCTGLHLALIVNFGTPKAEWKRVARGL